MVVEQGQPKKGAYPHYLILDNPCMVLIYVPPIYLSSSCKGPESYKESLTKGPFQSPCFGDGCGGERRARREGSREAEAATGCGVAQGSAPRSQGSLKPAVPYSRLQQLGIWIQGDFWWCSFFLVFWNHRMVIFQLSGFYCSLVCDIW